MDTYNQLVEWLQPLVPDEAKRIGEYIMWCDIHLRARNRKEYMRRMLLKLDNQNISETCFVFFLMMANNQIDSRTLYHHSWNWPGLYYITLKNYGLDIAYNRKPTVKESNTSAEEYFMRMIEGK